MPLTTFHLSGKWILSGTIVANWALHWASSNAHLNKRLSSREQGRRLVFCEQAGKQLLDERSGA